MTTQNLLFICSRNQWRSPTAEKVLKRMGYNVRSAGTSPNAKRTVSANDLNWADLIFVMERKHKDRIRAEFAKHTKFKKIHVLDIPDEYQFMDEELIEMIKDSVLPQVHPADNASN